MKHDDEDCDSVIDERMAISAGLEILQGDYPGESDFAQGMRMLQKMLGTKKPAKAKKSNETM